MKLATFAALAILLGTGSAFAVAALQVAALSARQTVITSR
jgi:hypothetical protein